MEVRAQRTIAAPPEALYAFLEAPDRHWQLLGRRLEPLRAYDGERSQVRLRGPLGVRRTLWIRMSAADPPHELVGRVETARGRTVGTVRWAIRPTPRGGAIVSPAEPSAIDAPGRRSDAGPPAGAPSASAPEAVSVVELIARTDVAAPLDRLLLACGGAAWLQRALAVTLAALDARMRAV